MRVTEEEVKAKGLTTLYQPDDANQIGLDIIFVHGLGGHPVKTWLHRSTGAGGAPGGEQTTPDDKNIPRRHDMISPPPRRSSRRGRASSYIKGSNMLKKRQPSIYSAPPVSLHAKMLVPRPQSAEPVLEERAYELKHGLGHVYSRGQLSPTNSWSSSRRSRSTTGTARSPGHSRSVSNAGEQYATVVEKETYWPLDLLPDVCPTARISTYGFQTHIVRGQLVAGQLDLFARGRELLDAVDEMRRSTGGDVGGGRELVFVAHSTGGIVVKEMLRLASNFLDTDDEGLLASIASVIFMGCPLSDTDYGRMVVAMRSMAAATTQVLIDDRILREVLGGDEDVHLTYLGRDAFDAVWRKYNFAVKVYRETTVEPPLQSWAELGLALRRAASTLEDNREVDEELVGDHVGMCRFGSASDSGFRSISSYISRLAHHQALRRRALSERDALLLKALANPDVSDRSSLLRPGSQAQSSSSQPNSRQIPQWLSKHASFQAWLDRTSREDAHKLLRLNGPTGPEQSELLSSLQAHISNVWAPETHSSAIITVTADRGASLLEQVLFSELSTSDDKNTQSDVQGDATPSSPNTQYDPTPPETPEQATHDSTHSTSSINTINTLRSLLSQLYAHDLRLRNLVYKRAATKSSVPDSLQVFETNAQKTTNFPSDTVPSTNRIRTGDRSILPFTTTRPRRWSDPTRSSTDLLSGAQTTTISTSQDKRGDDSGAVEACYSLDGDGESGSAVIRVLEDSEVVSLFLEDYLHLGHTRHRGLNRRSSEKRRSHKDDDNSIPVEIPGIRRVFILVDASHVISEKYLNDILWCLIQLSIRSDFSVCVATPTLATMSHNHSSSASTSNHTPNRHPSKRKPVPLPRQPSPTDSTLLIQIPDENLAEIRAYVDNHLSAADTIPPSDRAAIAAKMLDKAAGVRLWAEIAAAVVNDAAEEGVAGEVILGMLDDMAPSPRRKGNLDDLYAWKLGRPSPAERAHALIVMQWVMLAPEPLRLNELLVALRLTLLVCRSGEDGEPWDIGRTLEIEPAMSLKDLRRSDLDELGVGAAMDSPAVFWKWLRHISQGLLKLESGAGGAESSNISSEPLGLQRVRPAHESVLHFFLRGKGFQTLLPPPSAPKTKHPPTDRLIDTTYYTLLHVVLTYLNTTDLDALSRERKAPLSSLASPTTPEETSVWRAHTASQRAMVTASYPFLRYAVANLVFHLLSPRQFRYFLPQRELLRLFSANRCRVWRRWTLLLGLSIAEAEPAAVLKLVVGPDLEKGAATARLLDPVYGARWRLERVLRRVWKIAREQQLGSSGGGGGGVSRSSSTVKSGSVATTPTTPRRPGLAGHGRSRSDVSERSMVFTLMGGGDDPLRAQWLVPTASPGRPRASSSPTAPRSPRSPRALEGIREMG